MPGSGGSSSTRPVGKPTTQEPQDRSLISDSVRGQMGAPTEAEQETQRLRHDAERGIAGARESPQH